MTCIRRYWDVCWESRVLLLVALFLPLNVAQNASAQTQANRTSAAQPPTLTAASASGSRSAIGFGTRP